MLWRLRKELVLLLGFFLSYSLLRQNIFLDLVPRRPSRQEPQRATENEFISETMRLRRILEFIQKEKVLSHPVAAQVVSIKPFVFPGEIILNKGSADGMRENMAVISIDRELIGRVVTVNEHSSVVFTIFHQSSKISVVVQSSREIGIVRSGSTPFLALEYILSESRLSPGDAIVTSGFSEFYPRGLHVGTIAKVRRPKNELLLHAYVKPCSCFAHLEEVIVGE